MLGTTDKLVKIYYGLEHLTTGSEISLENIAKALEWELPPNRTPLDDLDHDTLCLSICKDIDGLDHHEFRLFIEIPEKLLAKVEDLNYYTFSILAKTAELISARDGFFLSSRQYPNLQKLLKADEQSQQITSQLEVLRSQLVQQLKESNALNNQPLGENLLELLILHSSYSLAEDASHDVYNTLIKIARTLFSGLSFQQVMRLCHNINELLSEQQLLRLLIVQNVETYMSFTIGESLIKHLLKLRDALPHDTPIAFEQIIEHAVAATRITEPELGRLLFLNQKFPTEIQSSLFLGTPQQLKGQFWGAQGPTDHQSPGAYSIDVQTQSGSCELKFSQGQQTQTAKLEDLQELQIDQFSLIYRESENLIAIFPLIDRGLSVSKIQLHYKGNHILKNISIHVREGEMVAVVGPSGCGKSTMLTMLAGMLQRTGGDITFKGKSVDSIEEFSNICTYIPQDDILFRELTVHESIKNSLQLKVKGSSSEHQQRLRSTIDVLGLERTEFLKIGNEGEKGISGGQRKRVNIGTTIVADMKPILLFDEPTSGLDPATDVEIMQLLRQLSRKGHIVMVVTHNLSAESLAYFDQLMVLDKNGQLQFWGKDKRARYFFNIRSTHLLFQKMKEQSKENYADKFAKTPEAHHLLERVDQTLEKRENSLQLQSKETNTLNARPGMVSNFFKFLEREYRRKSRDLTFLAMCLIQPILISVFISWNFDGPIPNAIFSLLAATLWIGAISGVREINTEMPQLKRDVLYGTSLSGYLGSKVISCFSFSAFQVTLLTTILFLSEGYLAAPFDFHPIGAYGSLLTLNLFGISLGLFMSAAIRSALAAVGLLPVLLIPLLIMGGALIRHNQVDGLQWWAMKINPLRITYESMIYSGDKVLLPSLEGLKNRSSESAQSQSETWKSYLEKKALFDNDPEAYKKKYEEVDVNDLFSSMLDDSPKASTTDSGPAKPVDVTEPDLLMSRPDLWLSGHKLLDVDHASHGDIQQAYPVRAPKAFSDSISAQGMTGMFHQVGDDELSVYSPIEYGTIPLLEIILLQFAMYLILLVRVNRKN